MPELDVLEWMTELSARRAADLSRAGLADLRSRAADAPAAPPLRLSSDEFDLIAEIKRRSPGDGGAPRDIDPAGRAVVYSAAGAAAVSVLTEPEEFGGSLDDLEAAGRALAAADRRIPTMRKDFLVDPHQVLEARAAGAGGVLLIADLLGGPRRTAPADEMLDAAAGAGVWLLIEAFRLRAVDRAVALAGDAVARGVTALVGVNVRDLRTLAVEPRRRRTGVARIPPGFPAVAESGLHVPADAAEAASLGYRLALVGRALSESEDPGGLVAGMIEAGRGGRSAAGTQ